MARRRDLAKYAQDYRERHKTLKKPSRRDVAEAALRTTIRAMLDERMDPQITARAEAKIITQLVQDGFNVRQCEIRLRQIIDSASNYGIPEVLYE